MNTLLETILIWVFNRSSRKSESRTLGGLCLGRIVIDGRVSNRPLILPWALLATHIWIFGATGTGKSKLIQLVLKQALRRNIPAIVNALHGDLPPFVMAAVAEREQQTGRDLSGTIMPFTVSDPEYSPGMNLLAIDDPNQRFVMAAELIETQRLRWHLQDLGPRTSELARNSLYVLSEAGLTLLELPLFLTDRAMRTALVTGCSNQAVREYFLHHFDQLSESQQATYRAPLLNKFSELLSDPAVAHCVGQIQSSLTFRQALDERITMLVIAEKARLGERALTLLAVFSVLEKNSAFARRTRHLALLVFDEAQNFVRMPGGVLETLLSESRKLACGVILSHQSLEQVDTETRAALFGTGVHVFFRLGATDAERVAGYLGGGRHLAERLRSLPQRHAIVKTATGSLQEIFVSDVPDPTADFTDLYNRCRKRWMRPRTDIAAEIERRHELLRQGSKEELHDWD